MERLTTDSIKYFNEIKKELTDVQIESDQTLHFTFCEIGQLLNYGFSVSLISGEKNYLKVKTWNAVFDNTRFNLNIYNLDRLAITEKVIDLNTRDYLRIHELIQHKLEVKKIDGIILDGLYCQFKTNKYCLNWNIDNQMESKLCELIKSLRKVILNE